VRIGIINVKPRRAMENTMGFLSPKYWKIHQASQPSQQTPNGKLIINFTPMPNCALISIHSPIIPIPINLFQIIFSSSFGPLTFFLFYPSHPLWTFSITVI
jgi:hypothetical protein